MLKYLVFIFLILMTACSSQNNSNQSDWELSGTFEVDGTKLIGKEGRLGFVPRGASNIAIGGHFSIYFWGKQDEIANTYRLIGVHKETGTTETLYPDWQVTKSENEFGADAQSGAKYMYDKKGTWRLEVYMGDKYFDSIVVEAL